MLQAILKLFSAMLILSLILSLANNWRKENIRQIKNNIYQNNY